VTSLETAGSWYLFVGLDRDDGCGSSPDGVICTLDIGDVANMQQVGFLQVSSGVPNDMLYAGATSTWRPGLGAPRLPGGEQRARG